MDGTSLADPLQPAPALSPSPPENTTIPDPQQNEAPTDASGLFDGKIVAAVAVASFLLTPAIVALPLICLDYDLRRKTSYTRGLGAGAIFWGFLMCVFGLILGSSTSALVNFCYLIHGPAPTTSNYATASLWAAKMSSCVLSRGIMWLIFGLGIAVIALGAQLWRWSERVRRRRIIQVLPVSVVYAQPVPGHVVYIQSRGVTPAGNQVVLQQQQAQPQYIYTNSGQVQYVQRYA
ncbi:hypothetical protein BJ741DRAFT_606236 [Chytriomyces cf. hyalinus JEL632]|nr:hypothetical protein BJ741DRAFT_606236 [Chytriomyces cf. hyalinus JEL632]